MTARALIAEDEPLLAQSLKSALALAWPELQVIALAGNGIEALRLAEAERPDVVFLDIRMPGLSGLEVAAELADRLNDGEAVPRIVFVTAYDEYAISAFEAGAIDYLLKPAEEARLKVTMERVLGRLRLRTTMPSTVSDAGVSHSETMLQALLTVQRQLNTQQAQPRMRWLQCSAGQTTRMVAVEDILFFRSDEKYTRVQTLVQEFLIRTPIRELVPQLDEQQFWQIHRSTIVNVGEIAAVHRDDTGKQRVSLKHHAERLEVSRSFSHLFKHQ